MVSDGFCHLLTEMWCLGCRYREQAHSYRDRIPLEKCGYCRSEPAREEAVSSAEDLALVQRLCPRTDDRFEQITQHRLLAGNDVHRRDHPPG